MIEVKLITPSTENLIHLSDGRKLGYAEYGTPAGKPIFYFHTHPGSRINGRFMDEIAKKIGVQIIAPDRPGCGLSDFKPERTFLDWPQDVLELADHIKIDKFAVLGASGGGPYAAVCAYKIPQRVTSAGLLASVGPMHVKGLSRGMQASNRIIFGVAKYFPKLVPYLLAGTARGVETPARMNSQLKSSLPAIDVQVMDEQDLWPWFIEDLQEAFRNGVFGPSQDVLLYVQPWGFSLEDIEIPVYLWQGEDDVNAPLAMGQYMARLIPACQAKFYPKMAHLSVIFKKAEEALQTLADD